MEDGLLEAEGAPEDMLPPVDEDAFYGGAGALGLAGSLTQFQLLEESGRPSQMPPQQPSFASQMEMMAYAS